MVTIHREITKEQYINATEKHICEGIFKIEDVCGYGIYGERFYEKDGRYYVSYMLGDSCD